MAIAITVWGNRVSPVFDSSNRLLTVSACRGSVLKRSIEPFDPRQIRQMAVLLNRLSIDTLICGAITDGQSGNIINLGIRLIPFISGGVEEILDAYIQKQKLIRNFLMPGTRPDSHLKAT
jgi:predicted Fe-Mo cluster-binding NifX family protein